MLGGFGQMVRAERLTHYDVETIWDDRVPRRTFDVFGGVPRVELADAGGALPDAMRERLARAVALGERESRRSPGPERA